MKVTFDNVQAPHIRESFLQVLERYPNLHNDPILLKQESISGSTMQAQPIITVRNLFSRRRAYRVRLAELVRDSPLRVDELPMPVLTGWFAHELGHLADFEQYTNLQMVGYGARYLLSAKQKRKAEHEADYIALRAGFKEQILATKRFLLEHDLIDPSYKLKIEKYYLSIDDVELWRHTGNRPHLKPDVDMSSKYEE